MGVLLLGLVTGIAFGYILYRAGVSRCGCIFDALNLLNLKAVKLMLTAVAVGSLLVYPMAALGWGERGRQKPVRPRCARRRRHFWPRLCRGGVLPGHGLGCFGRRAQGCVAHGAGRPLGRIGLRPRVPVVGAGAHPAAQLWPALVAAAFGAVNPIVMGMAFGVLLIGVVWPSTGGSGASRDPGRESGAAGG